MKMNVFSVFFVVAVLLWAHAAQACSFKPAPFESNMQKADTAFIGMMKTDEAGLAIFDVEKAIKGVQDGDEFSTEIGLSSCDIRFRTGQIWLYAGASHPDGSMLLMDEYGRINIDQAKIAKENFGYDVEKSTSIVHGVIKGSCAPWDGAAFVVGLDNGVTARVYKRMPQTVETPVMFGIGNNNEQMGGGSITVCSMGGKDCKSYTGSLFLGQLDAQSASGMMLIKDGEHAMQHVFRVTRDNAAQHCG